MKFVLTIHEFSSSFDPEKNVSSSEDIILSEHVEESLPHELCDIP
jgi:hypothetical protein